MADLLTILFGRVPGIGFKTIGLLQVDVFTREIITYKSDVTENPIETGAVITDHVVNRPTGLRVNGTVRNANRALAYNLLVNLHETRQPVFVATGLQTFQNMAITELTFPRDPNTANSLEFTCDFRQLRFVSGATAQAGEAGTTPATPSASLGAADTATPAANLGRVQASPATPADTVAAGSVEAASGGLPQGSLLSRLF